MARKTETIRIPPDWGGRDAGKMFRITEMDSDRAEKWAIRAVFLARRSNERIPDNLVGRGMEAIFIIGINIFLSGMIEYADLAPLLDEMMTCVAMIRDPRTPDIATPIVSPDDIEEVRTRMFLRSEVLRLHTGFSPAAALSALISVITTPTEDSAST